jgi:hypothetical protein
MSFVIDKKKEIEFCCYYDARFDIFAKLFKYIGIKKLKTKIKARRFNIADEWDMHDRESDNNLYLIKLIENKSGISP